MKFVKKPVVIDAVQWFKLGDHPMVMPSPNNDSRGVLATLEGAMEVSPGDWIICGVKGEFYPCKPDIFLETYELAQVQNDSTLGELLMYQESLAEEQRRMAADAVAKENAEKAEQERIKLHAMFEEMKQRITKNIKAGKLVKTYPLPRDFDETSSVWSQFNAWALKENLWLSIYTDWDVGAVKSRKMLKVEPYQNAISKSSKH